MDFEQETWDPRRSEPRPVFDEAMWDVANTAPIASFRDWARELEEIRELEEAAPCRSRFR